MIDIKIARQRYKICKNCAEFNTTFFTCGVCKCFMKAKVLIETAKCPKGTW